MCDHASVVDDALGRAVLDLGLEDDIPLWEIADHCRGEGLIAPGAPGVDALAEALIALARRGEVRIYVRPWDDPTPRDANVEERDSLLLDRRRYSSAEEIANDLERVYYVNVDNIVE